MTRDIVAILYDELSNERFFTTMPEYEQADTKERRAFELLNKVCEGGADDIGDLDDAITDAIVEREYLGFAAGLRTAVKIFGTLTI